MELGNFNIDDIGYWPIYIKATLAAICFAGVVSAGIWFDTRNQLKDLKKIQKHEVSLKDSFEKKQHQASNLDEYKRQLKEIKKTFGTLLRQLPEKTEVPGLLEDISNTGVASGLEIRLFKPLPEKKKEFYAELPIKISVVGNYHQLATFVSHVSGLSRIVTLHDFTIKELSEKADAGKSKKIKTFKAGEELVMDITAKTYRYTE